MAAVGTWTRGRMGKESVRAKVQTWLSRVQKCKGEMKGPRLG